MLPEVGGADGIYGFHRGFVKAVEGVVKLLKGCRLWLEVTTSSAISSCCNAWHKQAHQHVPQNST